MMPTDDVAHVSIYPGSWPGSLADTVCFYEHSAARPVRIYHRPSPSSRIRLKALALQAFNRQVWRGVTTFWWRRRRGKEIREG